ncbi:MAG: entericidin A/B family lipoprotein [Burkholderiaceae bacterium]
MKYPVGFAAGLASLFLVGCNTMSGMGEDIQTGGEKLEKAAEKRKAN